MGRIVAALTVAILWSPPLSAQTSFVDVAATRGMTSVYATSVAGFGSGAAASDFDDDGDIDLFLPTTGGSPHLLYRNLGGSFEEVAGTLDILDTDRGRAALWLDVDGDHRLDLLISIDCYQRLQEDCDAQSTFLRLYRQTASGTFVDTTVAAGLAGGVHSGDQHRSGMAAADVNGDGYVDIATGFWMGAFQLWLNQGDGTFVDVTSMAGIDDAILAYHQPGMLDVDGDGLIDIFAAVDFTENRLWLNQGTGAGGLPLFIETAEDAGCANAMNDMGVALGDYDADGDPDFYVTNIYRDDQHNVLLRSESMGSGLSPNRTFSEVSAAAGVEDGGWGWGTTFLDLDHDGDLDLAETNGWRNTVWDAPPRLFLHQGDDPPTFVDHAAAAGLTDESWGSSLVAIDYDRDGDLDLVETVSRVEGAPQDDAVRLYENQLASARHFLVVRPRMAGPNTRALGARVVVEAGGRTLTRWITAGGSYLGQEPAEAHFGLDGAPNAERITVHWPNGGSSVVLGIDADRVITVTDDAIFADGFEAGDALSWSGVSP